MDKLHLASEQYFTFLPRFLRNSDNFYHVGRSDWLISAIYTSRSSFFISRRFSLILDSINSDLIWTWFNQIWLQSNTKPQQISLPSTYQHLPVFWFCVVHFLHQFVDASFLFLNQSLTLSCWWGGRCWYMSCAGGCLVRMCDCLWWFGRKFLLLGCC